VETVKVVCLKWGEKYGAEWVTRLRAMVARHLQRAHRFVCYTERNVAGVECAPLPCELPHWWCKLGFFRLPADEDTLYLDLDVVIDGQIELPELDDNLWALDDFSYSLLRPRQDVDPWTRRLLGGSGTINSSVMYWRGAVGQKVWDAFKPSVMNDLHGDQNWITRCLWPHSIRLFPPGMACSYKYHVMRGTKPAPIVVFHGNPKAPDLPRSNVLRQTWESAA
jgi:hypothetical protein